MTDIPHHSNPSDMTSRALNQSKPPLQSVIHSAHVRDYITDMLGQLCLLAKDNNLDDISSLIDVTHKAMIYSDPNRLG